VDAIAASPSNVPVPEWHAKEPEKRLLDPDPQWVPWSKIRERLKGFGGGCGSASAGKRFRE